ncbi:LysM peptidoglycan-binding domain-containing protein [Psychromonas aquatilis]|uniref:LysM peptidoglycan-binding domain-containing protein n=1 Tax=Psychromonas aquatilis TaxID=2005072 RepID=A0ABU9GRQ2_9GAMM
MSLINSIRFLATRFVCFLILAQSISFSVYAAQKNELESIRTWPSPDKTRVVFDLSQKPKYETHYLTKPDRLVIDFSGTVDKSNLDKFSSKGKVISNIRESKTSKANTFRVVIDLKQKSTARIFSLPPAKPYGHRLVIDLPLKNKAIPKTIAAAPVNGRDIIVAVDAGHGGDDPGALGKYSYEKKVTLQIAKRLKNKIDSQKGMHAFLIRTGDYFVNLNRRSEIARKGQADFLVSIHADGFTSSRPKGASVWVLSNRRATTELGRWMEKNEAQSELLGGAGNIIEGSDSVPFLNKMLLDMSMGNTMGVGYNIGSLVTNELSKVTTMHKKEPVHASLAVLKSPDIPSILVEAGFITNHTEERLLNQAEFQTKIANAVYKGIYNHFSAKPPQGTLFAQTKRATKHTVRNGESLSILAQRYGVSIQKLKSMNNLSSNSLQIGQVLNIPANYRLSNATNTSQATSSAPRKASSYKVVSGDSLSIIARKYNLSSSELMAYNNLSRTQVNVGQVLKIPGVAAAKVVQKEVTHKVEKGEFLSLIAGKYNKSTEELVAYNHLSKTQLNIGQVLKIPGVESIVDSPKKSKPVLEKKVIRKEVSHKVSKGEFLSLIAKKYNKTTSELVAYNNLSKTQVNIGQIIKIPDVEQVITVPKKKPVITPKKVVQKEITHQVTKGESLSLIAAKYNKSMAEITAYNGLSSTSIRVGQKLKIPGADSVIKSSTAKAAKQKEITHKVTSGESLSVIAAKYDTTTSVLKRYNGLTSSSIKVGQKIKIPGTASAATVTKKTQPTSYKVVSGDSLSEVAERFNRSSKQLMAYNKLSSSTLFVGQTLKIPSASYKPVIKPSSHTVKSGESLSVIASKYGLSTSDLKSFNQLRSSTLSVGQKLKIPTNKSTEHKVRSGESLSVIAQQYGTTSRAIMSENNLKSSTLSVGQVLTIPVS